LRIALVEDDADQARMMTLWLEAAGYDSRVFSSGREFISAAGRESFDLLIMDWLLPDIAGDEVVGWVRKNMDWPIPVLFVTRRDDEKDIVHALEQGADDYMIKPARRGELLARVEALLRRASGHVTRELLEYAPFRIDDARREVTVGGEPVELTQKEYELTRFLFSHIGRILSRGHILESVWGRNPDINTRTVDTHVSRIRKKLGLGKRPGWRLNSIYQHGYRLEQIDDSLS